jgi:hypothetical protein
MSVCPVIVNVVGLPAGMPAGIRWLRWGFSTMQLLFPFSLSSNPSTVLIILWDKSKEPFLSANGSLFIAEEIQQCSLAASAFFNKVVRT